jgi:hypothetical protein
MKRIRGLSVVTAGIGCWTWGCGLIPLEVVVNLNGELMIRPPADGDGGQGDSDIFVTVEGLVGQSEITDGQAFVPLSQMTIGGQAYQMELDEGEFFCTEDPAKLRIQDADQDFYVLFGPNPEEDDTPACGRVIGLPTPEDATFQVRGTWTFFWGTLPRPGSRLVVLSVPLTTGVLQVLDNGENRVFLIDPDGHVIFLDTCLNTGGDWLDNQSNQLDKGHRLRNLNSIDIYYRITPGTNGCVVEAGDVQADGLSDEIEAWKRLAKEAGWKESDP